jgi:hypothetical protein
MLKEIFMLKNFDDKGAYAREMRPYLGQANPKVVDTVEPAPAVDRVLKPGEAAETFGKAAAERATSGKPGAAAVAKRAAHYGREALGQKEESEDENLIIEDDWSPEAREAAAKARKSGVSAAGLEKGQEGPHLEHKVVVTQHAGKKGAGRVVSSHSERSEASEKTKRLNQMASPYSKSAYKTSSDQR